MSRSRRNRLPGWRALAPIVISGILAGCSGPADSLRARLHLKEGNLSYLKGDYKHAIQEYDTALRYTPQLATAQLNRAYSFEALSRAATALPERQRLATEAMRSYQSYLAALESGSRLESQAPNRSQVDQHIFTLLVDSQQRDTAIAFLQSRIEHDPRDLTTVQMLTRLEMERGRQDEALQWQRKGIAALPDRPEPYYNLGAFVWQLSYRNPAMDPARRAALLEEGIGALRKALELRPDDPESLVYMNLLYLQKAQHATQETERAAFEAQAKAYRDRAVELRKSAGGRSAPAAGTPTSS